MPLGYYFINNNNNCLRRYKNMNTTNKLMNELLLGFNGLESFLHADPELRSSFPPHNILKISETEYNIELAVAGYAENDIVIVKEKNELTISGEKQDNGQKQYIHRGISGRRFSKKFYLADNMEINTANLENGMLTVTITALIPEQDKPKTIPIGKKQLLNG
jgi:molecular chaperone IbpA